MCACFSCFGFLRKLQEEEMFKEAKVLTAQELEKALRNREILPPPGGGAVFPPALLNG